MSTRRVLAISQDLETLRQIVASLEYAGASVDAVRSPDAVATPAIPHRYVFLGLDAGDPALLREALPRLGGGAQVCLILRGSGLHDPSDFLDDPRIHHVLSEREHGRGVFVTAQKLVTGDIFGLEKYLPEGTPVGYERLRRGAEVPRVLERVRAAAAETGMDGARADRVYAACEALLENALYAAPIDDGGRPVFDDGPSSMEELSPRPVSLRFAKAPSELLVSVRDRFGRLARTTIVSHLGAGRGLNRVASAASGFVVNVAYAVATEVICVFDTGGEAPLELFSVFTHPRGAEHLTAIE